jgi:ankyrin repeat protein
MDAVQRLHLCGQALVQFDKGSQLRGWTPLYIASRNGHIDCVKMLVSRHASVVLKAHAGESTCEQ